jgi:magnesium chelatase family protein
MTIAVIKSRALAGMQAPEVSVEVHLANGLPAFTIVGLADTEVKESRDRVRAAITNAGFKLPEHRITVNLAPADLPKESGRFDLPIAVGILAASGQILSSNLEQFEFAGELSLTGELRPIRGALAMTYAMQRSSGGHARGFILPMANADEAALVAGACIYPAATLLQVCAHFGPDVDGSFALPRHTAQPLPLPPAIPDFADVKGQVLAKRAMEVAAAGRHSVLLVGPPGAGKTMLATRFAGLLPLMTDDEALEAAAVQSPLPRAAPHILRRRPGRRRQRAASRRNLAGPLRRVVPRRIARVRPPRTRSAA